MQDLARLLEIMGRQGSDRRQQPLTAILSAIGVELLGQSRFFSRLPGRQVGFPDDIDLVYPALEFDHPLVDRRYLFRKSRQLAGYRFADEDLVFVDQRRNLFELPQANHPVLVDSLQRLIRGIQAGKPDDPGSHQQHRQKTNHKDQTRFDAQIR